MSSAESSDEERARVEELAALLLARPRPRSEPVVLAPVPADPVVDGDYDARRHLEDYQHLALLYVKRYVAFHSARMTQAQGTLSDLFVSVGEVQSLLARGAIEARRDPLLDTLRWPPPSECAREVERHRDTMRARLAHGLTTYGGTYPIEAIREGYALDDTELELLMAAVACQLSVDLARLYAFAWADFAVKAPSVGFLAELVADHPRHVIDVMLHLRDGAPLVRHGLLEMTAPPGGNAESPLLRMSVSAPDQLVWFLTGATDTLPAAAAQHCERVSDCAGTTFVPRTSLEHASQLVFRLQRQGGLGRLMLTGRAGSGRRTLVKAIMGRMGRGLLAVDLGALVGLFGDGELEACLQALSREATLRDMAFLVRADALARLESEERHRFRAVCRVLDQHRGLLVLTTEQAHDAVARAIRGLEPLEVAQPSGPELVALWQSAFVQAQAPIEDAMAEELSSRYALPPGRIFGVADAAVRVMRDDGTSAGPRRKVVTFEQVGAAVKQQQQRMLRDVATPVTSSYTWSDLVIDDETRAVLEEVLAHVSHRGKVMESWGFNRKLAYGRGLSCLFSGPPGTGKTMSAGIIANAVGRPLMQVDLSRVTSKWIGETEKNLGRIFDEAETADIMLLFDEADSLFSKRTEVSSSNDRYANMSVNFLLQRMERFSGMSILTTNFDSSLDDAFKRRIRFRVRFPFPTAVDRERLWRSMIPSAAPLDPAASFTSLAQEFEFAGGNIKNAALRAAFFAAAANRPIGNAELRRAAVLEAREFGMVVRPESPKPRRPLQP